MDPANDLETGVHERKLESPTNIGPGDDASETQSSGM